MMTRLDELISENVEPSFILDFIDTAADIRRLFSDSLFFQRIFQLDFFLSCSRLDIDRMFKFAEFLPSRDKSLFALQVLLSESGKAQYAKYRHQRILSDMSSAFGTFNSYVYLYSDIAERIRTIDRVCFKAMASGDILSIYKIMPVETFKFFTLHIGFSLFQNRIAQLDVLLSMPQALQMQLANGVMTNMSPGHYIRFVKSVFMSDMEMELKTLLLDRMKASKVMFLSNDGVPYVDLVSKYSSFQELVLKDSISCRSELNDMFAIYLLLYMPENLKTWLDSVEQFPSYLRREDVDELISHSISHGDYDATYV